MISIGTLDVISQNIHILIFILNNYVEQPNMPIYLKFETRWLVPATHQPSKE
jgi:hypothetical protein